MRCTKAIEASARHCTDHWSRAQETIHHSYDARHDLFTLHDNHEPRSCLLPDGYIYKYTVQQFDTGRIASS
jgi:hypothetical protein